LKGSSGIRFGILYSLGLLCVYCYGSVGFGMYQIWDRGIPATWTDLFHLALGSLGYLTLVFFFGLLVLGACLYLFLKDPFLFQMKIPLLVMILVAIFSPVLGPMDESLTLLVGYLWKSYFFKQDLSLGARTDEGQ